MSRDDKHTVFFYPLNEELDKLVERYKRTGDRETLAQIVKLSPPAGDHEIGKAISIILRNKRPDKKVQRDAMWGEIIKLFRYLRSQHMAEKDAYTKIQEIYFSDPADPVAFTKDIDDIRRQHQAELKRFGENF